MDDFEKKKVNISSHNKKKHWKKNLHRIYKVLIFHRKKYIIHIVLSLKPRQTSGNKRNTQKSLFFDQVLPS